MLLESLGAALKAKIEALNLASGRRTAETFAAIDRIRNGEKPVLDPHAYRIPFLSVFHTPEPGTANPAPIFDAVESIWPLSIRTPEPGTATRTAWLDWTI